MALNATNVANALIDTLNKLSNADTIVMSREANVVVVNLQNLCVILADAADAAAEAPGTSPLVREDYANFSTEISKERLNLEDLRKELGGAQATPPQQKRLVETAKKIAHLTSEMILLTEGINVRRIVEESKTLARWARAVLVAVAEPYDTFMQNCQSYGQASVTLARSLKEYLQEIKDAHHKAQVSRAYEDLREACPRLVQTAARCFDAPTNTALNDELQQAGKELAGKIAYAISVAHPPNVSTGMAPAGRGVSQQPVSAIPITLAPEEQPQGDKPRKRTVREAGHGTDILNRVRTATINAELHQQMGDALSKTKGMARAFEAAAPVPPVTRPSVSTSLPPMPVNQPAAAPTQVHVASKPAPKFVMGQRPAATGNVGAPNISPLRPSMQTSAPNPPSPRDERPAQPSSSRDMLASMPGPPSMAAPPPPFDAPAPPSSDTSPELLQRVAALEAELQQAREAHNAARAELDDAKRLIAALQPYKQEYEHLVQVFATSAAKFQPR